MQFLSTTVMKPQYRDLFDDPSVFSAICEKVAIPNMQFKGMLIKLKKKKIISLFY